MDTEPTKPTTPTDPATPLITPQNDVQPKPASFQPTVKVEPTPSSSISDVTGVAPSQTVSSPTAAQPETPSDKVINDSSPDSGSKKISKMKLLLILLTVAIVATVALFGGYSVAKSSGDSEIEKLNSEIAKITSSTHPLPSGATKLSPCIPNMGFHYIPEGSDPEYGPFMMVNTKNEVIGIEYMLSPDMFTAIPDTKPAVSIIRKDSPMYSWVYDHADISYLPDGHHGLEETHNDIHIYTVTRDYQKQACVE